MKHIFSPYILLILFLGSSFLSYAQDTDPRYIELDQELNQLARSRNPELLERVDLSLSNVPIQDYILALAKASEVSVSINPSLSYQVSTEFSDEQAKDVILYLCKTYNLDVEITGSILYLDQYEEEEETKAKSISLSYDSFSNSLSADLRKDTISKVAKLITEQSNQNIVLSPGTENILISGFVKDAPLDEAIRNLTYANGLESERLSDGTFVISKVVNPTQQGPNPRPGAPTYSPRSLGTTFNYTIDDEGQQQLVTVEATKTPILDLVKPIADELGLDYYFLADFNEGVATVKVDQVPFEEYLNRVLESTKYTYVKDGPALIFGDRNSELLKDSRMFQFKYRTADTVLTMLPKAIKEGIETKVFPEYNSVVLSGPKSQVDRLEYFFDQMDKQVPVVELELIVVTVQKGTDIEAGIKGLGVGAGASTTQGNLFDNQGVNLGAKAINDILNAVGPANIGRVGPNFFAQLVALETNNNIKITNTTRLATLNSHTAEFSIGDKEYYLEEEQQFTPVVGGGQNNITRRFKEIEAKTVLKVRPVVSGDKNVTLEVDFEESEFDLAGRTDLLVPPSSSSRKFTSLIRVQDQEMIVLGGVEQEEKSDVGKGVPFLSRVPVIKWFFSNRKKKNNKSRLIVFIRPTIVS